MLRIRRWRTSRRRNASAGSVRSATSRRGCGPAGSAAKAHGSSTASTCRSRARLPPVAPTAAIRTACFATTVRTSSAAPVSDSGRDDAASRCLRRIRSRERDGPQAPLALRSWRSESVAERLPQAQRGLRACTRRANHILRCMGIIEDGADLAMALLQEARHPMSGRGHSCACKRSL